MTVASEVNDIGFRPGIVNLRKFEHRTGNSPSRNSLNFQNSVELLYAGMKPSLAHVDNTLRQETIFMEGFSQVVLRKETTPIKIRRVDMSQQLQATLKNLKELRQLEAMAEGQELASWAFLAKGGTLG